MLTTVIMATKAPVVFCPAMNVNMFENPIVQENMVKLKKHGYLFVEPNEGELACGAVGTGRMAEPQEIMATVSDLFAGELKKGGLNCDLAGLSVMVTAGPTREAIDSVRYITNHSTGKMGYAIARRARSRGADVLLITGPSTLAAPAGVETVKVTSAADMNKEVKARFNGVDAVIKAAAVADVTPLKKSDHKLKKEECGEAIKLGRTEDILKGLGKIKGEKILVGFAAETRDLVENAERKLREKNLDLIVINDVSRTDAGFAADTNEIKIIDIKGAVDSPPLMMKEGVAEYILDRVKEIWQEKRKGKN
jgi:phosphopantothenoylcysteine decarboxylase/phosphopantothenate--cysteine ligase